MNGVMVVARKPCLACGDADPCVIINMKFWLCMACYSTTPAYIGNQIANVNQLTGIENGTELRTDETLARDELGDGRGSGPDLQG